MTNNTKHAYSKRKNTTKSIEEVRRAMAPPAP
jgi:hypothetical protein